MKKLIILLLFSLSISKAKTQINVRVKSSGNVKEVDIKTGGKPSTSKSTANSGNDGEVKRTSSDSKTVQNSKDTSTVPVAKNDESYNGPAKVQLKSFWRFMEKLRTGDKTASTLSNAVRMLDQVKKTDPSYNTTAIDAELKPYVDKDKQETAEANQIRNKEEEESGFVKDMWHVLVNIYSKDEHGPTGANNGEEFLSRAKQLDLTRFYSIRDGAGAEASSAIKMVDDILKDYNAYLDRCKLINWVYGYINKSKSGSPEEKMENLNQAKMLCEGVLMIVPDRKEFKQKLDDIAKITGNVNADVAKSFTSDFHKEHLNKIVFSTKPLVIGKEKEMTAFIKNDFKPGEMIFGTVYLGRNVKEAQDGKPVLNIRFKVEHGREIRGGEQYLFVPATVQEKPFFQFALVPDEQWLKDNYKNYIDRNNWTIILIAEALADDNSDPLQKVDVELNFWKSGAETVNGAFSYDISDGATALKDLAKKLRAAHLASVQLPKAGMSNSALEQQMLAVANGLGWNDKFTRTIIRSSEWHIKKNELTGAIIYRGLSAVCITKDDEGRCYFQEFTFTQDYVGGGSYGSKLKYGGYGGKYELTCDKIK